MRLFAVGLSHRTAPVELRECVDFTRAGVEAALSALASRGVGREAVVLSTCNRAEIYAIGETAPKRPVTWSAWRRVSILWSSASPRSSGR
jgi:glutamyl-tRNA reductase